MLQVVKLLIEHLSIQNALAGAADASGGKVIDRAGEDEDADELMHIGEAAAAGEAATAAPPRIAQANSFGGGNLLW